MSVAAVRSQVKTLATCASLLGLGLKPWQLVLQRFLFLPFSLEAFTLESCRDFDRDLHGDLCFPSGVLLTGCYELLGQDSGQSFLLQAGHKGFSLSSFFQFYFSRVRSSVYYTYMCVLLYVILMRGYILFGCGDTVFLQCTGGLNISALWVSSSVFNSCNPVSLCFVVYKSFLSLGNMLYWCQGLNVTQKKYPFFVECLHYEIFTLVCGFTPKIGCGTMAYCLTFSALRLYLQSYISNKHTTFLLLSEAARAGENYFSSPLVLYHQLGSYLASHFKNVSSFSDILSWSTWERLH